MTVHVLVPGEWSVQRGHDLVERLEDEILAVVPGLAVFTHLEPIEAPRPSPTPSSTAPTARRCESAQELDVGLERPVGVERAQIAA